MPPSMNPFLTPGLSSEASTPPPETNTVRPTKRLKIDIEIKSGNLCYPKSGYHGWEPSAPLREERSVINEFGQDWNATNHPGEDFNIWTLDKFTVYHNEKTNRRAGELCSLQALKNDIGANDLLLDGVLMLNGKRRYIKAAPFDGVSIEGYGDDSDTVSLYVQTFLGAKANVWYKLRTPADEYVRYFDSFRWLARFAKYFVEYMTEAAAPIDLAFFRTTFYPFISTSYECSLKFQHWFLSYGSKDFRQALCANIGFLWKEAYSIDKGLLKHPIWVEVDPQRLEAIPMQSSQYEKTVVTPFVYHVFKTMPFHRQLQVLKESHPRMTQKRHDRRTQLGLTPSGCSQTRKPVTKYAVDVSNIRQGDVVSVVAEQGGAWKLSDAAVWYAYIQKVRTLKSGRMKLDILWLYEPPDTTMGQCYYPFENELFMSDNCACGKEAIDIDLVLTKVNVTWFAREPTAEGFFVRQKFRTTFGTYDFVSLSRTDFCCGCQGNPASDVQRLREQFDVGDTVLLRQTVNKEHEETLEPAFILQFTSDCVILQMFFRARRDLNNLKVMPNRIILSPDIIEANPEDVVRGCHIRTFPSIEAVQSPYDRGGAGDFFYVIGLGTSQWNQPDLPDGPKLRGMGIFCGGGSFDRGLEEGGGVTFKWGIDWAEHALHTYRANLKDPKEMCLFLGSVNDYLAQAMLGSKDASIAEVGDMDMLAAGSPCPGFSILQRDKTSIQSLRNCSLVASVCSYVDFFMPKYLIFENVLGLAHNLKHQKDQNVFSQILCCLVALGYQTQQFLMDPGHYGSCQSRRRMFIVATAPGLAPLTEPPQTHDCPDLEKRLCAIGTASNGLPFGQRRRDVTPFHSVSAKQVLQDLPDISDAHVHTCIEKPDHRVCRREGVDKRSILASVPRWPYGQGFVQAVEAGKISKVQIDKYRWENPHRASSKNSSWSRVFPDKLVGCITTQIKPHDSFSGRVLHYDQPRCLTVMEARRVQGIPDDEVLIGAPYQQWKIVGNSVDRKVAFALGLQLGDAVRQNEENRKDKETTQMNTTVARENPLATISQVKQSMVVQSTCMLPTPQNTESPHSSKASEVPEAKMEDSRLVQSLLA